jgi:molecular chaperone Hsp33
MTKDSFVRATAADNQLRCFAAVTTNLVSEACQRHRTFPTTSVALGRVLTGTLLLGSSFKDLERITVHFSCTGAIRNIFAQADALGNVRGYVTNPGADSLEANELDKFDVRAIVGGGTLYVQRMVGLEIGLNKEPYTGSVPIVSGEIGDDFAFYLAKSEQINSAVGLGVFMNFNSKDIEQEEVAKVFTKFSREDLRVANAGGYLIQVMPEATEETITQLEQSLTDAPSPTALLREGLSPAEILQRVLSDMELTVLDESEPQFQCNCTRQRALMMITALGREDIEDMIVKENGAEVTCHYCSEVYRFSGEEMQELLAQMQ